MAKAGGAAVAIDPIALAAISGAFKDKEVKAARDEIAQPCRASFDLTVKVAGVLTRGEPQSVAPTCSLLNKFVFVELMRRLGVTRAAWEKALLEISLEANVQGRSIRDELEAQSPELLQAVALLERDVIAKMPPASRAGAIKVECGKRELSKQTINVVAA